MKRKIAKYMYKTTKRRKKANNARVMRVNGHYFFM